MFDLWLSVAVFVPSHGWAALATALGMLGLLGSGLAKATFSNSLYWFAALVSGGIVLSILGIRLKTV
jgi:hypothetical protein